MSSPTIRMSKGALAAAALLLLSPLAVAQGPHECSFCHVVHAAPGPTLGVLSDVETICLTCHGPAGTSALKATVHSNDGETFSVSCFECHTPHSNVANEQGGTNIKLIGRILDGDPWAKISTPSSGIRSVVFQSRGTDATPPGPSTYSFADDDEDADGTWDGVCEVCHTTTTHHYNLGPDPTPKHHVGKDCTACHGHDDRFMPSGGSCQDCHGSPQDNGDGVPVGGRRAVVGEFSLFSHHLNGDLTDGDCTACHDMSQHQQGRVRLFEADIPTNIVELLGDPMTQQAEAAKLAPFCLSCHDSDGAGGNPPFSTGGMAPVIDATAWASSSHQVQTTCFGDGIFGCHSTGHGSYKKSLLAPFDSAPTSPDFAEEEEGFCYNCHDGSPASTDLETEFAKGVNGADIFHHPLGNSEQAAGRLVECVDCHDPHRASSASLLAGVRGVDLAGNPVGPGTTNDRDVLEYELCFVCHGDGFNASRPRTTNKRTDFAMTNSAHHAVAAPGRNTSSNIAQALVGGLTTASTISCSDCHNNEQTADATGPASNSSANPQGPHGSANDFMLRGNYWSDIGGPPSFNQAHFQLCFRCHDVTKLALRKDQQDGARTNFNDDGENLHEKHLGEDDVTCANCHYNVHSNQSSTSHTSWEINGTLHTTPPTGFKTRLISFSPDTTPTQGYSRPTWTLNTSTRRRECFIDCHGKDHKPKDYRPNPNGDDDPLTIP